MTREVLLLRHAATEWNAAGRIQGRADVPLSPAGFSEAAHWRLPPVASDWPVLASPLARALETARTMGRDPTSDPAFVEMDWGGCEGRTLADLRAGSGGDAFAASEARGLDFRPDPAAETPREVGARALSRLRQLEADAAIVTHKGVIRALVALAWGWDMRGRAPARLPNATAHHLRLSADGALAVVRLGIPLHPMEGDPA